MGRVNRSFLPCSYWRDPLVPCFFSFGLSAWHQFDVLAKDTDTPMVRRAVASNVGNFAGVVEGHLLLSDVVPVFEALSSDDQDNVRLLAVEQAGKVAKALVDQVRFLWP